MPDRDLIRRDRPPQPAISPKGTNYLLAIAINDYQHCTKLNNAVRDVEAFIELMTTRYRLEHQQVTFIKDTEATKKRIESALDDLIDFIKPQDNLIVYFSGHGRHHERRGGYWVPVEAGQGDKDWPDYISNVLIKDYLSKIKSFHTFLIADSCFSGSFFLDKNKEKRVGECRDTDPSRWGLTSGKQEIVSDGEPGHHSPFASALLSVLRKADKPLGVVNLCDQVREIVATKGYQTPIYSPLIVDGHQYGQMVFYFREDEEKEWERAQTNNTANAYEGFLDKNPHGKYSVLAIEKLEELDKKEKEHWGKIPKDNKISLLRYITENPQSPYLKEAQRLMDALRESSTTKPVEEKREERPLPPPIIVPQLTVPGHMVLVKGGTFQMGEDKEAHQVILSDYLIAKYQITFDEYDAFCKATAHSLPDDEGWGRDKLPVINVNWFDAVYYCNWRSQQEGLREVYQINQQRVNTNWKADGYRLPTEAEWEYAARGGTQSQGFGFPMLELAVSLLRLVGKQSEGFKYAGSNNADEVAWYSRNSEGKTHPVGQKKANKLGLHDMCGNVSEWCQDWYDSHYYSKSPLSNPQGPTTGFGRVIRGGSWGYGLADVRVALRNRVAPDYRGRGIGFRLARQQ